MTKPKILLVTPWPPPSDGIATHSTHLAAALAVGSDVTVLCRGGDDVDRMHVDGVRVVRGLDNPWTARAAVREVAPDAVYVQFAIPAFGGSILGVLAACREARRQGARVAIAFHEATREAARLRWAVRPIYRTLLAVCDVPVVLTPSAASILLGCGATEGAVKVVPHGCPPLVIDPTRTADYFAGERPTVLCLGFIHPDKGIDAVLRAAALVRDSGRPAPDVAVAGAVRQRRGVFRFFGAADATYLNELRALVAALRLDDTVHFLGFLPSADLGPALQSAVLVALPYTSTTQSGIAALAMAAAAPVVASPLPGLVDFLGEGALYADPSDIGAVAVALERIIAEPHLRTSLIEAQRSNREAQSMAAVADRVVSVLFDPNAALDGRGDRARA